MDDLLVRAPFAAARLAQIKLSRAEDLTGLREATFGRGAIRQRSLLDERLNRGRFDRYVGFGAGERDGRHGQEQGHGDVAKKATVNHFKFHSQFTIAGA